MSLSTIIGGGKTFVGSLILISGGVLSYFGALPSTVHFDLPPVEAISGGLIALGLGSKLQKLIGLLRA